MAYEDLFDPADDKKAKAGLNLRYGIEAAPDVAARDASLAKRYGLPAGVIEQYRPDYDARAKVEDAGQLLDQSPKLRDWLAADPIRAKVSHDDIGNLSAIESAVRYLVSAPGAPRGGLVADVGRAGSAIVSGAPSAGGALYGAAASVAGVADQYVQTLDDLAALLTGTKKRQIVGTPGPESWLLNQQKQAQGVAQGMLPDMQGMSPEGRGLWSGLQSGGQNLITLPFGLAAKTPNLMLGIMGAITGGQSYGKGRDAGLDPAQAAAFGIQDAMAEIVTERFLGAAGFLKNIKAGASAGKLFGYEVFKEVPGEIGATLWQNFNEWANVNPDKSVADFLAEQPDAIVQTVIATIVGGSVQIGAVKGAEKVMGRFSRESQGAAQAQMSAQQLDTIASLIEAGKLRQRDPEAFATFAQSLTEEGVSSLYVDARALQQSGVDLQALAQALPSVAQQIEQAAATGGDVVIPTAEFLTQAPGQEWSAALIDHARTAADAMSPAGAREYMQAHGEQLQEEIAKTIEQHATDQEWQAGRDAVRSSFEAQLNEVGRFTPDVNRQYAALLGDYYAVTASRAGMTPKELAERYPLMIQATVAGGAVNAMEQGVRVVDPNALTFREEHQNRTDGVAEAFPNTSDMPPIVTIIEPDGENTILDGHNRAAVARDQGDGVQAVSLTRAQYEELSAAGYDDIEIAYAALRENGEQDAADALDSQFPGAGVGRRGTSAWANFPEGATLNQSARLPATIDIDGQQRPTTNSKGQQIAATEEGVRNFWKWFGASRVVDANGRPLVVYHSTLDDKERFNKAGEFMGYTGVSGISVTDSPEMASRYLERYGNFRWDGKAFEKNVMALYVRAENPLYRDEPFPTNLRLGAPLPANYVPEPVKMGHDALVRNDAISLKGPVKHSDAKNAIRGREIVVFSPEQIKSATGNIGTFDPANPSILNQSAKKAKPIIDQTQTEAFKRWSNDAPLVTGDQADTYDFKTGQKVVVEAFHGTKRPDRVGTKFLKKRATSGPMAYHTSDPTLASNYATGKADTSLSSEDQDYSNWFKVKMPGDRSASDLVRSWYRLTQEQKNTIAELAPRVMLGEEFTNEEGQEIVLGPEDHDNGTGSYDYNLAATRTQWDRKGNPLKALVEDWLSSGNLFNDEERFMKVLKLAGFPMNMVEYDSPTSEYPFVYKNFIQMQRPLVTSDVPASVVDALKAAAKKDRSRAQASGADMWDKNTRTLREWVDNYTNPVNDQVAYVWTSIPDKVTEVFKSLGYDGIIDWSGKGGGNIVAPVYIPFEETQVKSALGNKGKFSEASNDILKQDARAQIAFGPDITQTPSVISLFNGADLSSFIHEAGHFFLEAHMDLAGRIAGRVADGEQVSDGERGIVADANALLGWFGVTGVEQAGGAGGGALEQDAAWAEPTGKRSPITRKPVFELFDADGKSLGFTHSYVTAEDAIAGRNRPVSGPPAAPTYTLPEPELPPRSNWKQVKGQQFSNLDEDDGFLYHITAADRAAGIRENGLAPNSGGMFGGAYANYSAGKVFLTERSGVSYWQERVELQLQAASDNPPSVVVMRIPKDKITAQLTPDDIGTKDARARAYYSTATLFQTSQQGADQPDARPEPPAIGRTPLETWAMMSIDQQRAFHEQFARGFELYALEGKAPSLSLQSVFQRFSAWLKSVYRSITKRSAEDVLQVHLTDEVRQVMDRMIATDEQIAEAQAMREMGPLFGGADQAGMTPEQWAQYHELAAQATSQASEQLQARGLRDMQWLRNARSRELKRLQARAAGLRREVEMEVRRDVLSRPIYRAWQFLTTKGDAQATAQPTPRVRASGALDPASDNLFTAIAKLGGLDRSEVVGAWGVDPKDRLESGVFGAPVLRKENGLSIDAMAEKLAEEGYLLRDENGRTDPADLEAAFDSQRRGVDQYSTWHDLTEDARVRAATGADAPEALPDEIMHGKLDTAVLRDMYGTKPDALWRTLSTRRMTSEASGIHPEVVAETFGYDSADALVRALAAADPPRQVIEGLTDQRMLERYGDLATPEGLQRAADEAIHNEARARAIATELDALEKMGKVRAGEPRTADVLAKAARDYALAVIGAKKVRDIRPGEYTAAEARASKAAQKAFKAGDTQAAATEKRHQLIQHAAAKAALQAREEIDKTLDYLRRMAKRPKSIAPDYADQIDQLLERFDLRPASLKELDKRAGLQAWVTAQQEQGKEVDIPPELLNEAARTSWRNLTLDELRGLRDTVKQIEHLGRTKGKLLASKAKREFEAVRDELADGIELHSRGRTADTRTPATVLGRRLAAIKRFGAAHIKVATWARIFDGGRDGGPAWEYLIRGANDAGDFETTRRAQATEALTKILSPVMKELQRKAQYPSIGRSLTREQVLVMALNTGNEGNWQRMLDGEGWTRPQVMGVLNTLTAAEWQAVQGVWDHMESYRPEIGAKEKRVYGKEPEWVQSVPLLVDTSDGQRLTLRGGYFPIKYDPAANARAEGHADAEDAKRQMQGAYTSATTRRGFTKSRVQEVKGRPLMYSLGAVYGGVQDVIHDLAWHEWLIDTNKLLRSEKVDAAIRQHYGPEVVKQVKDWVKDIAAGDGPAQGAVDEAVSRLRRGVSVAGLGFNVMSAAMQPLGLTQSMVRVGAAWIGRGVAQYIANPRAAARRVNAASEFMASRARTRFRELNELRNQVEGQAGALTWVQQHSFWLMMRAQQTVDIPTWLGAYEKAISEGSDEARSVALADQAVIDSQGGGQLKDLAGIERGGPAQKLFTVFYSFFNTALNIGIGQGMTADTPAKRAKLAADALLLYSVPAVLGAILKDALQPGGDDDPEELAKKLAAAQLDYLMGLFVLVRETTEAVKIVTGLEDRPRDYAGPAGLRVIPDAFKFAKQAGQGEFDDAFRKAAVNLIGSAFGLPAAQVNRTITGAQALAEDETDNPAALVFGFQKER